MNNRTFITYTILAAFVFCGLTFASHNAQAQCAGCDMDNYYNELAKKESGVTASCTGGGSGYSCVGPLITDPNSAHYGDRPLGMYQFMPNTIEGMGYSVDEFMNNPSVQEQVVREFTQNNADCLSSTMASGGGGFDCGSLLAAAHLGGCGGAKKVAAGGNTNDAVATSYGTRDRAEEFAGVCAGNAATTSANNPGPRGTLIGCDPQILEHNTAKKEALQQMETEAAKALIGKPTSVMQTSCFEKYTQRVSEIGGIHSKPGANISGSIIPNVQMPAINFTVENFLSNALSGGIQSALNTAMGDAFNGLMNSVTGGLSGALGGLTGGGAGGGGGCNMMDEMWKILQCVDFPKMPGLSDILGGKLDKVDGVLKGLGDLANGKGIMGAVCQAASSMFGSSGGGSGSTDVFSNLASMNDQDTPDNSTIYDDTNHDNSGSECNYAVLLAGMTNMDADLNGNNVIEESELIQIDFTLGDQDCIITDEEIATARQQTNVSGQGN